MSRNEITLQENVLLSHRGTPGRRQMGDSTHLPISDECILGIHQMATNAHAQAEPNRTEEVRKLPQAEELQLEHRVHLHQDGTLGVSSGGGQKVHTVCTQTVRACIYRHTGGQEEGARGIRHQQPGKGDGKEPARRDAPKHTAENKDFLRTHVHAQGHTLCGPGVPAQKGPAGECAVLQKAKDGTGADRVTHTRSHADGQDGGEQESPTHPICFPSCRARKARKPHTGNTSRHSGHSTSGWQYSGSAWECNRHSAPMQPDTPGLQWLTIARYTPESSRKPWGTPPSR